MAIAFSTTLILYYLAIYTITCFISTESIGFTLRLIPRFSPESPLYPGNLTFEEKLHKAVELSKARANYIDFLSIPNRSLSTKNIRLVIRPDIYYYTTEVRLGTPPMSQFLIVDTGSMLLFTQCTPCTRCWNQTFPIFNPDRSTSYVKVTCDDPICSRHKCVNGECMYQIAYAGGSMTQGHVSKETLTFESDHGPVTVPNIVFGCGNNNRGFKFNERKISGILGLDTGTDSLISQLFGQIQGLFSYCLVYSAAEVIGSSLLRFGEDTALPSRQDIQTIEIVRTPGFKSYYVKLVDVSVGDKRVGFPPGRFDLDPSTRVGGCLIDTGATSMFFDEEAYDIVMKKFDQHFKSFDLERVYNVSEDLKFCYRYQPRFRAFTSMTLHFPDANYLIQHRYMYFHFPRRGYFCVAAFVFKGSLRKTIIGSWVQQDMRFHYDLNARLIRFMPENCAADQ